MAHFRVVLRGNKKDDAVRHATAENGAVVEAQSYSGKVVVTLYRKNMTDYARIYIAEHLGEGIRPAIKIYEGPINAQLGFVAAMLETAAHDARRRA